ncbi:hypothetical protein OROGR_000425 [Orobanche gracilis]
MEENIIAAIERMAVPLSHYKVSGKRHEFFDPNVEWKSIINYPKVFDLPAHCHPTADEVKRWRKNELMRYFVKLTRESTYFNKCKTLAEAAQRFTQMLEEGNLPMQLVAKRKHERHEKITHEDDWILAFDKSPEGRAIYKYRGPEALTKFWKGHMNDPDTRPWRHDTYRR